MYKVMIAGGRDFNNYSLLKQKCNEILKDIDDEIVIIQGEAKGADLLGKKYAMEKGYKVEEYPALWNDLDKIPCKIKYNQYGKPYNALAGFNRNKDMVRNSNLLVAFWDNKSKGTKDSIDYAKVKGVKTIIVSY